MEKLSEFSDYFDVRSAEHLRKSAMPGSLGEVIALGAHRASKGSVVLFTVEEHRLNEYSKRADWANDLRKSIYALYPENAQHIVDAGNLKVGNTYKDTVHLVKDFTRILVNMGAIPVLFGGGQDLTLPMIEGLSGLEQEIHLGLLDNTIDINDREEGLTSENYLNDVVVRYAEHVHDVSAIGLQRYFINPEAMAVWNSLKYRKVHLGELLAQGVSEIEPILRDCDVFSIDLNILDQANFSSAKNGPNGIPARDFCQIAKYMGMSDKAQMIGVFEMNTTILKNDALLLAEFFWCFVEGVSCRVQDYPIGEKNGHRKFTVTLDHESVREIDFFQSTKSGRWWFKAPSADLKLKIPVRQNWVSCSYSDYQQAMENKIPSSWWRWIDKNA